MMEPTIKMFVSENDCVDLDEARMAVISLRVTEHDGFRHVQVEGNLNDLLAALMDSDVLIVTVNAHEGLAQA